MPQSIAKADSRFPATAVRTLLIIEIPASTSTARTALSMICNAGIPYFFFLSNIFSIRCVTPKPPNTLTAASTMARPPGDARRYDGADDRHPRQGVHPGHQRRMEQAGHGPDDEIPQDRAHDKDCDEDQRVYHKPMASRAP